MPRILTGIQSTGTPHLGNILGAIQPAIAMAAQPENDSFLFIQDMHSLTQIKDGETLRNNTYATAATWLAFGLDIEKTVFYRQSDVPQVTELAWYLSCFFPYQRLTLAHSFKDKADRLEDVNAGLFTYPMLMAADILLYDAEYVPVGKDQLQHLEMTRDVAMRFHAKLGETFVLPEARVQEGTMYIPGTDGQKMSKSKGNLIDIFLPDKKLRKQIMGIVTDSTPLEDPKDPDADTVAHVVLAQIGAPLPGRDHAMDIEVVRPQPHALGAVEAHGPDVGRLQVVLAHGGELRLVDGVAVVGHLHAQDMGGAEQALGMLLQAEDGRALLGLVGPHIERRMERSHDGGEHGYFPFFACGLGRNRERQADSVRQTASALTSAVMR